MNSRVQIFLLLFIFTICTTAKAQTDNKNVTITVSGSGKTLDDAKQSALRSAIEQAYGSFISTKTEILNDQIVADQMASVSSGNIQSYEMLYESQLPDGTWGVTLKALVSISNLTSFVQAKGIAIEIKGGVFAQNIKQQILNEQGELKAITALFGLLHTTLQTSFDYRIQSYDPKALDSESQNWSIPLKVTAITNKNMDFCANYFNKTLDVLSLTSIEVATYNSLNKAVFPVVINYKGISRKFYLRNENSINVINRLLKNWKFYLSSYTVLPDIDLSNGFEGPIQAHDFGNSLNFSKEGIIFNFLTSNQTAAIFSFQDKRTLTQIEQLTGYSVKPKEVRYQYKYGGYVVFEKYGYGLVAAAGNLGSFEWEDAKKACDKLILEGYNDWRLPNIAELDKIYKNLVLNGIITKNFTLSQWSSSMPGDYCQRWKLNFEDGTLDKYCGITKGYVQAVRVYANSLPLKGTSLTVNTIQLSVFTRSSDNSIILINPDEALEIFSFDPDELTWRAKYKDVEGSIKALYLKKTSEYLAFEFQNM